MEPLTAPLDATLLETELHRLKRCRHGLMLYLRADDVVGRALDQHGEWAESELDLLGPRIGPGDTVLDVGANVGSHTLFFARAVGPAGRVVAFEPQRVVFQTLCANLALNGIDHVEAHHAAVGAARGVVHVPRVDYRATQNFGAVSLCRDDPAGAAVPVLALDELALPACRVLKVDVEGMELAVLAGAAQTIARCRPEIYIENNHAGRSPALIAALRALGYALHWHFSPAVAAANFFAREVAAPLRMNDINMLCVPPGGTAPPPGLIPVAGADDTPNAARARLGMRPAASRT